jgi:prevent-host-death family protein
MARKYSIAEARSNLPSIVDEAEAGLEVEITRRGKSVAVLISRRRFERLRVERPRFGDAYKEFLEKFDLLKIGLDDDFARSIRHKDTGRKVRL